eukprot:GHUV01035003.1.p1 GENE.GHUV01035003.1~~GHUV01035003.1.p1  ORF type:complete len:304 (+),score=47.18 GHUV01035003.1:83-913(+)
MYGVSTNCNQACQGANTQMCGGAWTNILFRIGAPSPQELAANSAQGYRFIGCYGDNDPRALPEFLSDADTMSVDMCYNMARNGGFKYFGLQYYQQCYAGNDGHRAIQYGPSGNCNTWCSGAYWQMCGGGWTNSLYEVYQPSLWTDTVVNCSSLAATRSPGMFVLNYTLDVEQKLGILLSSNSQVLEASVLVVLPEPDRVHDGNLSLPKDPSAGYFTGQAITLLLYSRTTYSYFNTIHGSWNVSMWGPDSTTAVTLGPMQQIPRLSDLFIWGPDSSC